MEKEDKVNHYYELRFCFGFIILLLIFFSIMFTLIYLEKPINNKNKEIEDYISNFNKDKLVNNINYLEYETKEYDENKDITITNLKYDLVDQNNLYYELIIDEEVISKLYLDELTNSYIYLNLDDNLDINEIYLILITEINLNINDIFYYENKLSEFDSLNYSLVNEYLYLNELDNYMKINKYGLIEELFILDKLDLKVNYKYMNI